MRIAVDTNVLVSAFLSPRSAPAAILSLILSKRVELCLDVRIVDEYRDVLSRPKFGFSERDIDKFIAFLWREGVWVIPDILPAHPFPDASDSMFIEVAHAANAFCLTTGNMRHFPERARFGVKVLTPADFLKTLKTP